MQNFIPVMSSEAGLCLSAENWREAGITTLSYSLELLLYKPGLNVLKKISSLSQYLGWEGELVLNAASLVTNKEGVYSLKSPYDGSKLSLTVSDLVELIHHLKPKMVILPKNINNDLLDCPQEIMPFICAETAVNQDLKGRYGVYFTESNLEQINKWAEIPRYVFGAFDPALIKNFKGKGIDFIETDEPAKAAFQGRVYSQSGEIDLKNRMTEMQFEVIDMACVCPACTQRLTKAYFYHLLQHTPLLCQRLLIQHNLM